MAIFTVQIVDPDTGDFVSYVPGDVSGIVHFDNHDDAYALAQKLDAEHPGKTHAVVIFQDD